MQIDGRATVLVVDDIPDNIMVLDELLRDTYNVCAATNGPDALAIVNSADAPDIILLDVMMPAMDGYSGPWPN